MNPFESDLERVARTLTEQFGVHVKCCGDEAWTDGQQIILPSLPQPMSAKLERMVLGFLDHEMAHVAFSDFQVVKQFAEEHPGYEGLLNVVEDALIEKKAMQRWPGVKRNLDAMFTQIRGKIAALAMQRDQFGRFCTAVYLKLAHYGDMLGMDAEVNGYHDLMAQFSNVRDTNDSAHLASKLLRRWLANHPPSLGSHGGQPDNCANGAPSDANGSGGQSNGKQTPTGSEPGMNGAPSPGQGVTADGADDGQNPAPIGQSDAGKQTRGNDPGNTGNGGTGQPTAPDGASTQPNAESTLHSRGAGGKSVISEALAKAIGEQIAQATTENEYRVYTNEYDHNFVLPPASSAEVELMLGAHGDVVRRLRRGLANALRSAEKRWWRGDQLRGELSPRSLHRLCLDRPQLDVFRMKAMVQGRATAVSIVLDASGSMTNNKMDIARDALRVLLQALADLKIAAEAITFTTGNDGRALKQAQAQGADPTMLCQRFSRVANLEIGVVKQFDESVKAALRRLPGIRGTGLTPLGEAMHIAAKRLLPRKDSRKVMLVLTDGRAGCESNDAAAVKHAQHVAKQIQKAGIELVGVGILDASLQAIVEDTIVVNQIQDLPAQLCKLLGRTLLKGMKHVG